jgi:hypothetical protein
MAYIAAKADSEVAFFYMGVKENERLKPILKYFWLSSK